MKITQVRIGVHSDSDASDFQKRKRSVSSTSRHSVESVTTVVTLHACDRRSCLGCGTLKLQALCYAAQQCSVVQCVGTIVNQNRPLCNVGLVLKSYMDGVLAMTLGAWLVFTESYTGILDAALLGPSQNTNIEFVDDAFFGYVCTAKVSTTAGMNAASSYWLVDPCLSQDLMGQATSILTSTIGAGITTGHRAALMASARSTSSTPGLREISDDAFTASVTMILNGVNAFMFQCALFPLYVLIATQKTIVCTANDVFGIFDATGFTVRVGKPELQKASDVSSGVCMTAFFESQVFSFRCFMQTQMLVC